MIEKEKKIFPTTEKKINGFLTNESKKLSSGIALALLGTSVFTSNNALAACTRNYSCTENYIANTPRAHSNQCTSSNYRSVVYPDVTNTTVRYCGIITGISPNHFSLNINGHYSMSPGLTPSYRLGLNYAPGAHSSHCNRTAARSCCSCSCG